MATRRSGRRKNKLSITRDRIESEDDGGETSMDEIDDGVTRQEKPKKSEQKKRKRATGDTGTKTDVILEHQELKNEVTTKRSKGQDDNDRLLENPTEDVILRLEENTHRTLTPEKTPPSSEKVLQQPSSKAFEVTILDTTMITGTVDGSASSIFPILPLNARTTPPLPPPVFSDKWTTTSTTFPAPIVAKEQTPIVRIDSSPSPRQQLDSPVYEVSKNLTPPSSKTETVSSVNFLRTSTEFDIPSPEDLRTRRVSFAGAISTVVSTPLASANDIIETWRRTPPRLTRELVLTPASRIARLLVGTSTTATIVHDSIDEPTSDSVHESNYIQQQSFSSPLSIGIFRNATMQSEKVRHMVKYTFLLSAIIFKVFEFGFPMELFSTKVSQNAPNLFSQAHDGIQNQTTLETPTLRQFLSHPEGFHLALGPAFFGFYAYFGALIAMDEEVGIISPLWNQPVSVQEPRMLLQSVSGASAGAMAAILLAAGISPRSAADFACTMSLFSFADPPGILGTFRGNKFERIMNSFLDERSPLSPAINLEDGIVPVAVTAFDVLSLSEKVLVSGSMARAARASATFPGLFQPVFWASEKRFGLPSLLIDGGALDVHGLNGLASFSGSNKRVVNVMVGKFATKMPPGPERMPPGVHAKSVLSISLLGTPPCGPLSMSNGFKAVESARKAILDALEQPLVPGPEHGHYILEIQAI